MIRDHRILTWDWRAQLDLQALANAVFDLSGGQVRIEVIDTCSDEYAIVISDAGITPEEAHEYWAGMA